MSDDHCLNNAGKDDDGETVSAKRKATGKTKASPESPGSPQYCRWLMKSEPESRFENGIDVKVRSSDGLLRTQCVVLVSGLMHLVHSAVWGRGSEGSSWSDRLLGWRPQLSGRATKRTPVVKSFTWNEAPAQYTTYPHQPCANSFLFLSPLYGNVPLNYLSSTGAQFYEADERRAVGFLLPQQLQGAGDSRSHESKSLSFPFPLHSNDLNKAADRHDVQLFPSLDCEGSLRGPHPVW